jgi:hypothetical protein
MDETAAAFGTEDPGHEEHTAPISSRQLLGRPTLAETEQIARACPPNDLSVPVLVTAIRRETGCSRATAYRAVADAFAAGVLSRKENTASTASRRKNADPASSREPVQPMA